MGHQSRGLRDRVVRALAKVGLVWALVVLGAMFMTMSAQAQGADAGYAQPSPGTEAHSTSFGPSGHAPRTAGVALALLILAGGITVLAIGASRGEREPEFEQPLDPEPDLTTDLSLALGLGLFA